MTHKSHNQIINFIWGIADDVLRDVFVRGKYRDIILPFTVLRRLDVLLEPTKEAVLEANDFLLENKIDSKEGLKSKTGYPFYNTSRFTMGLNSSKEAKYPFASLMSDLDRIDSNLIEYLDGFSENVQEIISKFKVHNQRITDSGLGICWKMLNPCNDISVICSF